MSSISGIGGGITVGNIQGLDLETAMMAIQSQRAELLETQLKGQLNEISKRNAEISRLNDLMIKIKSARPEGDKAADPNAIKDLLIQANKEGFMDYKVTTDVTLKDGTKYTGLNAEERQVAMEYKEKNWAYRSSDYSGKKGITEIKDNVPEMKAKDIDKLYEQIKGKIDTLNNSQQMDMLRMQSLTNKRNEAFDIMTNFIKKMADSRSSVLGNMR